VVRLIRGESFYHWFPFWDKCAVRVGNIDRLLSPISDADMRDVYSIEKNKLISGIPTYVSLDSLECTVAFFPTPDDDYELVIV
jgi:hypothetical protein